MRQKGLGQIERKAKNASCILYMCNCIWCNVETVWTIHLHHGFALAKHMLCCCRILDIQCEQWGGC